MSSNIEPLVPKLRFPEFDGKPGWEESKLGSVSEIVRGGSPRPIEDFTTSDPTGLSWLKIGDVDPESKYITHTREKVIKEALSKTRVVEPGDLILSNSMSFGRPYISQITTCIHDGWIAIRKIRSNILANFLYYSISSEPSQRYFEDNAAGAAVRNLNADIIKLLPIGITTKEEQQKIAACLSSLDDLITAETEKLEALKAHKKGLMQQLFPAEGETVPRLRFEGFEGEWEETPMQQLADKIMVGIASAATHAYRKSGVVLFRNQNIKENTLDDSDILYIDEEYELAHRGKRLKSGDILIARTGYPGTACVVPQKYNGAQSFTTLIVRPDLKLADPAYLCFYINSNLGQAFFDATQIGGGQKNVNAGSLVNMPVSIPSLDEQRMVASFLDSLEDNIRLQKETIAALKQHKKALLQNLFPTISV